MNQVERIGQNPKLPNPLEIQPAKHRRLMINNGSGENRKQDQSVDRIPKRFPELIVAVEERAAQQ